jgi:hypothetical protein
MLYKQDELDAGGNMSAGIKLIPNWIQKKPCVLFLSHLE